jgi:hypothetical protein
MESEDHYKHVVVGVPMNSTELHRETRRETVISF